MDMDITGDSIVNLEDGEGRRAMSNLIQPCFTAGWSDKWNTHKLGFFGGIQF
ncbi:MAG: hypothetical protein LBP80_06390 [Treponema sp.]|nr:hypothetical protein [Treponema sp.]